MSEVRPAQARDLQAIRSLVDLAYAAYTPRIGRVAGPVLADYAALIQIGSVRVLERDSEIVGLLVITEGSDGLLLENVAIRPDMQGQGLGRKLIAFAEDLGRDRAYETIRLYTNEVMVENLELYHRLGYVETHRAEEDGYRRVYLEKRLISSGAE